MAATEFFEKRLRGSDWGKPPDGDTTGFDTRIVELNGFVHLEMTPANDPNSKKYITLFSLSEAKDFATALEGAIRRVDALGET
jgi:hypothetical protein